MQKQNILRYASVKCTNPPPTYKNQVLFQNSLIYTKTKDDLNRKEDINSTTYSKNTRLHTEGSEPYQKTKYFCHPTLDKQKPKRQFFQTRQKQDEKKNIEPFGQKLQKGNSQKQFKFVGNFVNLKKNEYVKKQRPADYLPVWIRKDAPPKVFNNFVEGGIRPQNNVKNSKQGNGLCVGGQFWNSKQLQTCQTQPSTSYIKRTVKTQADEVCAIPSQVDEKLTGHFFRKSYRNVIRKTQTEQQPPKNQDTKCRMTATFDLNKPEKIIRNSDKMTFKEICVTKDIRGVNQNKENRKTFQRQKQADQVIVQRQRYTTNLNVKKQVNTSQNVKPFSNNINIIQQTQRASDTKNQPLNNQKYLTENFPKKNRMNTQENDKQPKSYLFKQRISKTIQSDQTDTSQMTPHKPIDWKRELMLMEKIGEGTFGKVYKAKLRQQTIPKIFAVKKVYIDKKYKSRELQIVQQLNHPQVMKVHNVFVTKKQSSSEYLNIVMDFYEKNLFEIINESSTKGAKQSFSSTKSIQLQQKVLIYQILKGLSYIHSLKICHRDIKPHNMLVKDWELVLCDFGSAKKLIAGENNLSYICSRCYRAPELIFGSTAYTTQIDIWSVACVILQMLHGLPLFIGQNSLDHLLEVIKVVGTPTKQEVLQMNENYDIAEYDLPMIKRKSLTRLFPKADSKLIDLVNRLLVYNPHQRLTAIQALCHPYFDELRSEQTYRTLQRQLPKEKVEMMYEFSEKEINLYYSAIQARNRLNKTVFKEKQSKLFKRSSQIRETLTPSWWTHKRQA